MFSMSLNVDTHRDDRIVYTFGIHGIEMSAEANPINRNGKENGTVLNGSQKKRDFEKLCANIQMTFYNPHNFSGHSDSMLETKNGNVVLS